MQRETEVSRVLIEFADTLVRDFDLFDFLHVVARRCADLLDVDAAGVLLIGHSQELRVVAASTEEARLLELFEIQNEEGPCLESFRTGDPVHAVDLEVDDRWPRFREQALSFGFHSVEAVPMRLRDEVIGAVNLFRRQTGRLAERSLALSQAMAHMATIGLLQERSVRESQQVAEQLQTALNNRVVIEQAKGVLAERAGVELQAAFESMRRYARERNIRLPEVARDVIEGRIPVDALGASEA